MHKNAKYAPKYEIKFIFIKLKQEKNSSRYRFWNYKLKYDTSQSSQE